MDVVQREYVVSGFAFYSEKDAGLAEQERQKIAYLDKRIDHADIQSVLAIYKKALENLGITDVEVEHSTIDDVMPGAADLFVCGADLLPNALSAGKAIGLENMVSMSEMESKLKEAFGL